MRDKIYDFDALFYPTHAKYVIYEDETTLRLKLHGTGKMYYIIEDDFNYWKDMFTEEQQEWL